MYIKIFMYITNLFDRDILDIIDLYIIRIYVCLLIPNQLHLCGISQLLIVPVRQAIHRH